jgi:hypothetical protein
MALIGKSTRIAAGSSEQHRTVAMRSEKDLHGGEIGVDHLAEYGH